MKPSSGSISISASARKIDVDNRIPLRNYYRIANNLLKQADIYRSEKNIIDLYVMLLRFSSLISETIPHHQDYHISLPGDKLYFRKRLLTALTELESLKPDVQLCLEDLNRKFRDQANSRMQTPQNNGSLEWPIVKWQTQRTNQSSQVQGIVRQDGFYKKSTIQGNKQLAKPKEERFGKLSFTMSLPKQETLSRHSILGPGGLHGQWQSPSINKRIHYPSDLDSTPVEIPSLLPQIEDKPIVKDNRVSEQENSVMKDNNVSEQGNTTFQEVLSLHDEGLNSHEDSRPMINLDVTESLSKMDIIKELSPPPVLAEVQDVSVPSQGGNALSGQTVSLQDELLKSEAPLEVHISATMMDAFMRVAKSNTNRNLETCGVLAGSLKNRKFYVTSLIIPKQESTSDSCQTTNEEEIFEYQDKQSLFPLGWIHTHPTQSCFMSSIDVHTHYSYQVMLPEAIAIVMAPRDSARPHGIFRLTTPGGMSVIRHCPQRGFHAHKEPPDGGPLYDRCSDVYMDPKLKFDVVDLR